VHKLSQTYRTKGLKTFIVFQGGSELKPAVAKLAADHGITSPMVYLVDGRTPPRYKIDPAARNTIMLWVRGRVRANFVNLTPAQFSQVEAAAKRMLR